MKTADSTKDSTTSLEPLKPQTRIPILDYHGNEKNPKYSIKKWKQRKQKLEPLKTMDSDLIRKDRELNDLYPKLAV